MALAGLVGAACGLLLGRHIDAGFGRRAVVVAYGVGAAVLLLRAASLEHPWLAVTAHALGGLFWPLLGPTLGVVIYNLAKASPCPFRFSMATEGGWDAGCFSACLIAATLIAADVSPAAPILLALPALAAKALLLWRHYPRTVAATGGRRRRGRMWPLGGVGFLWVRRGPQSPVLSTSQEADIPCGASRSSRASP
jgi:hypothetical protein